MATVALDGKTSALVLVDLQKGILTTGMGLAPHSADAIVARAQKLAAQFRAAGGFIVWVRVSFSVDLRDLASQLVDAPRPMKPAPPPEYSQIMDGLVEPGDHIVTKRQWGAFYGTDLDLQLRRRRITTVAIGGVATNYGVESTARAAHEHGYHVVLVEDLCASLSAELHAFPLQYVFPRLSRVTTTAQLELT